MIGADGYEADDVIGTLATGAGQPVDIVTGDRDLFQLVDDEAEVRVLYIARGVGRHERVDNGWVRAKYDVDAHQYADFSTMRGDASDGLPGVAGVGEKTAATLLQRFGDLPGIIAAAHDPASTSPPGRAARSRPQPTTSTSRPGWSPSPATSTSTAATSRCRRPRATPTRWQPWQSSGAWTAPPSGSWPRSGAPATDHTARTVGPMTRIAVVGGHGKVAQHLLEALRPTQHTPVALVRKEEQRAELEALGAEVRMLDIEQDDAEGFARAFEGCDAVVFAAGGGADGDKERKRTVDLEGSLKSVAGAEQAGIRRFVQVSAIGVDDELPADTGDVWRAYVEAKRDADAALRASDLDWTILRPGLLTDDPGTGSVDLGSSVDRSEVPRADVAAVIAACLDEDGAIGRQWNLVSGDVPVARAVASLPD